ncbi:MAG: hypothetical protein IJ576_07685 [Synergistaceae bacterium]|nr:hypothetical protein [Synergistaceae bacterium]MBR1603995.1 hypothetical protein [Synergistaceae bacterium]
MANNSSKRTLLIIVAVVLVLNVMWTILQNKFTPKLEEVKADQAKFEQRVAKLERGGLPDVADLKDDFAKLKELAGQYDAKIAELVKAEEEHLKTLEAQVAEQKERVEALKKMAGQEVAEAAEAKAEEAK